jgi:hypothetical protein
MFWKENFSVIYVSNICLIKEIILVYNYFKPYVKRKKEEKQTPPSF